MARIKTPYRGPYKQPALSGGLLFRVQGGRIYCQAWPKPRGRPKASAIRAQNEWFRQASYLAKYVDSHAATMAKLTTKNSPWYPRDALFAAMSGRLVEAINVDGQKWVSMAVREDVSKDLDLLGPAPDGYLLLKVSGLWKPVPASNVASASYFRGVMPAPTWDEDDALVYPMKATVISAQHDIQVSAMHVIFNTQAAGVTYQCFIAEEDSDAGAGHIGQVLGLTEQWVSTDNRYTSHPFRFTTNVNLAAGVSYVIGVFLPNDESGISNRMSVRRGRSALYSAPVEPGEVAYAYALHDPTTGGAPSASANQRAHAIGLEGFYQA